MEATTCTVKLYFNLLALFHCPLLLLLFEFLDDTFWEARSAHRAANSSVLLNSMPRPNLQTLEVKIVSTLDLTRREAHFRSHSFLANRAN